jgi:hypothetical protein
LCEDGSRGKQESDNFRTHDGESWQNVAMVDQVWVEQRYMKRRRFAILLILILRAPSSVQLPRVQTSPLVEMNVVDE